MNSLWRWVYVSETALDAGEVEAVVSDILEAAKARNLSLRITGALIHSGGRFAQYLEGSPESLLQIKQSIQRDSRHKNVTTIEWGPSRQRQFEGWSLVYGGHANFFAQILKRAELGSDYQRPFVRDNILAIFAEYSP